jgi:hypothetical protein
VIGEELLTKFEQEATRLLRHVQGDVCVVHVTPGH